MYPVAELVLSPGGVISWIVMGLIAGWLAGLTMSGRGYGILRDTLLGLLAPASADWWPATLSRVTQVSGAAC